MESISVSHLKSNKWGSTKKNIIKKFDINCQLAPFNNNNNNNKDKCCPDCLVIMNVNDVIGNKKR
ncbi:hypothetical protein DERP_005598 [Dermatophagoides pteronyssinus]|uniref:Uncharacterized protein n=1 Tax=Dermatophagoides pteronyssinus TaxID=6956 RepID=A0ABQ8J9Q6_DERPT|nr:hypothetical protein DERP_005598 [Dermatophagoides pteronyssinus]